MAYDEGLAQRLREAVEDERGISEKKMFGGLCFLVSGNMCFGVVGDELMVRVGPEAYDACLARPNAREMDFTGRALRGMVYVGTDGFDSDRDLEAWVRSGVSFARSLPAKTAAKARKKAGKRAAKKSPKRKSAKKKAARKKASRK